MFNKMCIIGVGLIGGSIARAARENGLCKDIVGVGRRELNLQRAVELGVIDSYGLSISMAVKNADIVVLCSPVGSYHAIFEDLKPNWSKDCLYVDVGSTKQSVIASLNTVLGLTPENFVPSHPIAGSENNGIDASLASLFEGSRTIITPVEQTSPSHVDLCKTLWEKMGARVSIMTALHHDEV